MDLHFLEANTLDALQSAYDTWVAAAASVESLHLSIGKNGAYVLTINYTAV